jgi:hypothetical protein
MMGMPLQFEANHGQVDAQPLSRKIKSFQQFVLGQPVNNKGAKTRGRSG